MAKNYSVRFGSGDPRQYAGLSPTFLIFSLTSTGASVPPPVISEIGPSTGIYYFQWGTTTNIAFLVDAATTSPGTAGRYVFGVIDPSDRSDEYGNTLAALGNSNIAIGVSLTAIGVSIYAISTTLLPLGITLGAISSTLSSLAPLIGTTASLIGDNTHDPVDMMGYMKRLAELYQGDQTFIKGSPATISQYDRTGATLLYQKSITNNVSLVTKS